MAKIKWIYLGESNNRVKYYSIAGVAGCFVNNHFRSIKEAYDEDFPNGLDHFLIQEDNGLEYWTYKSSNHTLILGRLKRIKYENKNL